MLHEAFEISILIMRLSSGKGVYFQAIINFALCVILGVSVDFGQNSFSSVYVSLGH